MAATVELRLMTPDELIEYRQRQEAEYATEMVHFGGMNPGAAAAKARASSEELFAGGNPAPDHYILAGFLDDQRIGEFWFGPPPKPGTVDGWIYDVAVVPGWRGRGLGRSLMTAGEQYARSRGVNRLGLNVYGGNAAAISLYESLGYAVTAQQMAKRLP